MTLAEELLSGNRLALTRLLTQVENDTSEGRTALTELFPHTGKAHLIGQPGSNQLIDRTHVVRNEGVYSLDIHRHF